MAIQVIKTIQAYEQQRDGAGEFAGKGQEGQLYPYQDVLDIDLSKELLVSKEIAIKTDCIVCEYPSIRKMGWAFKSAEVRTAFQKLIGSREQKKAKA